MLIHQLKNDLTVVKSKIEQVNIAFADGSLNLQEFKELKNPLVATKTELEQQLVALGTGGLNRIEPLRSFILEANQADKWVKEENWLEMKSFLRKVGSNRLLRTQPLTVSFTKPFDSLAKTNQAVRNTHDLSAQSSRWWWLLSAARTFFDEHPSV